MRSFSYCAPTEICFGEDTVKNVGELVKKHGGKRIFVIYGGGSAVKSGLTDKVKAALDSAGLESRFAGGVVANPLVSKAQELSDKAVNFGADFILAVGGGSVIDTAKAVAHVVAAPETPVWDFWSKKAEVKKSTPVGVVLTISAAGSEMSNSAVLTNDLSENPTKRGLTTELQRPCFAIMDPVLTMTLPPYQIGAGAADIFMHTSERYFTTILGNHLTDEIAEGLFRDIVKYGPIGVKDPHDYEAMSEIMWCGSVSHSGLTGIGAKGDTARDGDWSCHQLGMALSAIYNSTHGATLSAVWAAWARYVMNENVSRFASFARKVYGVTEPDGKKAAEEGIEKTNAFFSSLGMPLSLTELLGYTPSDEELIKITDECSYGNTRKIGTFKVLNYDDMLNIYKACR